MAVQKSKVSRSRRGHRRSHDSLSCDRHPMSTDYKTGEMHIRHHMTADGFYRGKQIINNERVQKDLESNKEE